jgi:hypothetical protein
MGGGSLGGGLSPTFNKLLALLTHTCTLGKHKKLKLKNKI